MATLDTRCRCHMLRRCHTEDRDDDSYLALLHYGIRHIADYHAIIIAKICHAANIVTC